MSIGLPPEKEMEYYRLISKIESGDNPKAKNPRSTASGRFQFIKSTWEGLGYQWGDVFDDVKQWEAIKKFTRQNARTLEANGCAINFATLYGAHFLGVSGLLKIMRLDRSDPIEKGTSQGQRTANPSILKGTVGDFCDWLKRKTGDDVAKRYTTAGWNTAPEEGQVPETKIPVDPPAPAPKRKVSAIGIVFVAVVVVAAIVIAVLTSGAN